MRTVVALLLVSLIFIASVHATIHVDPREPPARHHSVGSRLRGTPDASAISYKLPGHTDAPVLPVQRTVAAALSERVSVLDFGAVPESKADQTAIFAAALASNSWWPMTLHVPTGTYVINGCLVVTSRKTLHLEPGAVLVRNNCSTAAADACAVVSVEGTSAAIIGDRDSAIQVKCSGGADNGVVRIGPVSLQKYQNVEWNVVAGVWLSGPGDGVGIRLDSAEPFVGGSCYQNTVRDIIVSDVAVGVLAVKYVNANRFSNINMLGISKYGVQFVNNTENSLDGIFVTGSRNISAVIKGEGSGYNLFTNIQSEPGGGQLFNFDARSERNQVQGHDNCPHGSESLDPAFTWIDGGRLALGDFSAKKTLYDKTLIVQGDAYITALQHGLPRRAEPSGVQQTAGETSRRLGATELTPRLASVDTKLHDGIEICLGGSSGRDASTALMTAHVTWVCLNDDAATVTATFKAAVSGTGAFTAVTRAPQAASLAAVRVGTRCIHVTRGAPPTGCEHADVFFELSSVGSADAIADAELRVAPHLRR